MEGFPPSRLPGWNGTEARIQAAPSLGASFAWYHLKLGAGGGTRQARDDRVETFFYVLSGAVLIVINDDVP
jgi:(S)-ureidoglycine aminohydrolase